jgi:hypothetical protein
MTEELEKTGILCTNCGNEMVFGRDFLLSNPPQRLLICERCGRKISAIIIPKRK